MKKHSLLFCFLLTFLCASAQRSGKDYAVFFPVTEYADGWQNLPKTRPELDSIASDLRNLYGFNTIVYANQSKKQIKDKLAELANRQYGPQDQLLLFFSMHGNFDDEGDAGCLVPFGSKLNDPTFETWLLHTELRTLVAKIPCLHTLLVLDACYSGTFGGTKSKPEETDPNTDADCQMKMEQALSRKSRIYLTSGGKEKVPAASAFAQKWRSVLGMRGGEDGILFFSELYARLSDLYPVPRTGRFPGDLGGDFIFLPKNGCNNSASAKTVPPAADPSPVRVTVKEKAADWEVYFDERGRKGFKNSKGETVISPRFPGSNSGFQDGLADIRFDGKYGFIDTTGKVVLLDEEQTDISGYGYSDNLRPVAVPQGIRFVDKSNLEILEIPYFDGNEFSEGLMTVYDYGKAGVINKKGEIVIPFQYEDVEVFYNGLAIARSKEGEGVIDRTGKVVIPFQYKDVGLSDDRLAIVRTQEGAGVIDRSGKTVIPIIHERVSYQHRMGIFLAQKNGKVAMFNKAGMNLTQYIYSQKKYSIDQIEEGLLPLQLRDKWGYINKEGNEVLPFQFDSAEPFTDGYAVVNHGHTVIDKSGRIVLKADDGTTIVRIGRLFLYQLAGASDAGKFHSIREGWRKVESVKDFSGAVISDLKNYNLYRNIENENWLLAEKNGKYGVVNRLGKLTIPVRFDSIKCKEWNSSPFLCFWDAGKTGIYHLEGKIVIPARYDTIVFTDQYHIYAARSASKWVFINIDNTSLKISKNQYDSIIVENFESALLGKRDGRWCIVDAEMQEIIPPSFQFVYPFFLNRTWAFRDNKWGLIDASGREITGFVFEEVIDPEKFEGWWWAARKNGKWGYLDITGGKTVIGFEYDAVSEGNEYDFDDDLAIVKKNGKWGGINRKGQVTIKFEYKEDFGFLGDEAEVTDDRGRAFTINRYGQCIEDCPNP